MTRTVALVLAALLAASPLPARAQEGEGLPEVGAGAWILYDETYDRELGSLNPDERRAIASTTKIMTALVVLERAQLHEAVEISQRAADIGEAEIGLVPGERIPVYDLVVAMMVGSGNDAAMALAEHVGGTVDGFVEVMNQRAAEMGLANTSFTNPHGLDEPDHFSTARDLLTMSRVAMDDPVFAEIVQMRRARFPSTPTGREREARTTNTLLRSYPGAFGIKTGFTGRAGLALVAGAERDGRRVFSVVLGADDHFADTAALLEFAFEGFGPVEVLSGGVPYAQHRWGDSLTPLVGVDSATVFMSDAEAGRVVYRPTRQADTPSVAATVDGAEVARVALSGQSSPELPDIRQAAAWASRYWERLWGTE